MKFSHFKAVSALVLVSVAGCANISGQQEELSQIPVCCRALGAIPTEALSASPQTVAISDKSPVFEFPQGRSRFRAFELAPSADQRMQRRIRLESLVIGPTNVYTAGQSWARYFHPAITFMDMERRPLGTFVATFNATPPDTCGPYFGCPAVALEVTIPNTAKSFVIHEPYEILGKTTKQAGVGRLGEQTVYAGGALLFVPGGSVPIQRIIAVSTGEIRVTVLP